MSEASAARYQSEQFAREATQAKIAELTLRIKILEHANQLNILSEKHAQRRLAELQGAARKAFLALQDQTGAAVPWDIFDAITEMNALLPHEDAS